MKSLKVKLFTGLSMFVLVIAMLIVGVWAVGEKQTITLDGNITFEIDDTSLFITNVRVKDGMSAQTETIDGFVPGFINTNMHMNLGEIKNISSGIAIYIDVINTTTTTYVATSTSQISGAVIEVSGTIAGDGVNREDILATEELSGTIELVISAPGLTNIDLSQITISLDNLSVNIVNNTPSLGSASYSSERNSVTLSATLNNNTAFYGWAINSVDGFIISDLPSYSFEITDDMPTTFYPIFKQLGEDGIEYSVYRDNQAQFNADTSASGDLVVASTVNIDNAVYTVTALPAAAFYNNNNITSLTFPSTLTTLLDRTTLPPLGQVMSLTTIRFRPGSSFDSEIFVIFNESSAIKTIIIDSFAVYEKANGVDELFSESTDSYGITYKVLGSIDDKSNTYLTSNYSLSSTEMIDGQSYNVYTK